MRLASYVPGELIPLPLSGSIPELPHVAKLGCVSRRSFGLSFGGRLARVLSAVSVLVVGVQYAAASGVGARYRSLASRLRFCAVAVSSTSSLTPFKPRSRSRSSLSMRFMWANRISTFLRSRRDCWKASVLQRADTIAYVFIEITRDFAHNRHRALQFQ